MKINYFGYFIINERTNTRTIFDIRPFIRSFCQFESADFKSRFIYSDENLYLFHQIGDMFLFLMTRSNEIIKKINTNNMNLGEIYQLLGADEQLGFASYTVIKDHYLAFGSTILAPKFPIFSEFINMIFESIGLNYLKLGLEPLMYQATRSEILAMPFLGKTVIEIQKNNSFAQDLIDFVGANAEDVHEIDSFELIIKPRRKQNIKPAIDKFLSNVTDEGLQRMIVKAKNETQSHLSDLYLIGKGAISDSVASKNESRIYNLLTNKMESNDVLHLKVGEFINDERFEEASLEAISRFINTDTWSNLVPNILPNN